MKVLLDTHIFLWIFIEPQRFSKNARLFVEDVTNNDFFLSDVSAWETSIKYGLGKLDLPQPPESFFPSRVRRADYRRLRVDLDHVTKVHSLPQIHRDPFDRLLISQAAIEDLTILSEDPVFANYAVSSMKLRDIS